MSDVKANSLRKLTAKIDRRKATVVVALVITSLVVTGAVWANHNVTIVADGRSTSINTFYDDPARILEQAGIALGEKDEYRLSTAKIQSGTVITVYRAVPVQVILHDKSTVVITGKPTAGELAASMGYPPGKGRVVPGENTKITPMMQVRIIAVSEQTVTRTVTVAPPVVREPDPTLEIGLEELVEEGDEGLTEATVKVRLEDGRETSSETLAEKVLTPAKPQVIKVGTRETVQTSRGALRFRKAYWMEATAYLPSDGGGHGITASGLAARHGIVAVDPAVIPLGTRLYVPGYGMALAADTGGDIRGERIDLCMEESAAAWRFGRRMIKVYVLAD